MFKFAARQQPRALTGPEVMGLGDMNYSRFNNMGLLTDLNLDAWTVDSANVCMLECG